MNWQRLFSSIARRNRPSGEAAIRRRLVEDCDGNVTVSDLIRSVIETRLPTGEIRRELFTTKALPPLYGAPRRFWNL